MPLALLSRTYTISFLFLFSRISSSAAAGVSPGFHFMSMSTFVAPGTSDVHSNGSGRPSRYESQKRRDWNTFGQYLKNHRPPLALSRCSGAHVLEFLRYLDQFGKTKVHNPGCPFFGLPQPPAPCPCPLRQAWGSLDALVGRLRAAFEENGGHPDANPFGARAVRLYLRQVRDSQAKARGIAYEKKKRKRPPPPSLPPPPPAPAIGSSIPGEVEESFQNEHGQMMMMMMMVPGGEDYVMPLSVLH